MGSHYDFKDVERMRDVGKVISVPVSFVQVDVQTDPRWAKTNSNIPSPGKARSVKSPTPGPTITMKSPPHALPPLPAGFKLIGGLFQAQTKSRIKELN